MITIHSLDQAPTLKKPIALTIGSFDGIHLGHQSIFAKLHELGASTVVLTFTNHPSTILSQPIAPIYTPEKKNRLIASQNIDLLIDLPFTKETASHTYQSYLTNLHNHIPFDYLVLGEDARLGKGRLGTPDAIRAYAQDFTPVYLPKLQIDGQPISSRHIRAAIKDGNLTLASKMLGRPYS